MKVDKIKPTDIQNLTNKTSEAKNVNNKAQANYTDKVDISSKAKELAEIKEKALKIPEIRKEIVNSIKEQILSGNYKANPQKIAGKIIDEIV